MIISTAITILKHDNNDDSNNYADMAIECLSCRYGIDKATFVKSCLPALLALMNIKPGGDGDKEFIQRYAELVASGQLSKQIGSDLCAELFWIRRNIPNEALAEFRESMYTEGQGIIAKAYESYIVSIMQKRFMRYLPSFEDELKLEGMLGLIMAFKEWNPEKEEFFPFASIYIMARMSEYIQKAA